MGPSGLPDFVLRDPRNAASDSEKVTKIQKLSPRSPRKIVEKSKKSFQEVNKKNLNLFVYILKLVF